MSKTPLVPPSTTPSAPSGEQKDIRILVVEDSSLNRDMLFHMLKRLGYTADIAENGQQAIDILEQCVYDLVFMDCQMPVMDGYTATKEIRRREQLYGRPHIPIIALTAHALEEHRLASQLAGMDDHVNKPLHMQTLREVLSRWAKPLLVATTKPITSPLLITASTDVERTTATVPAIDSKVIQQLREILGEDMTVTLCQQFIDYAPKQLAELQKHLMVHNKEILRGRAHQFKGESLQLGATQLASLCKELETLAETGQLELATTCLIRIEAELERVQVALTQVTHHEQ